MTAILGAAIMAGLPWLFLIAVGNFWLWGMVPCVVALAVACWAIWRVIREPANEWRGLYLVGVAILFLWQWQQMSKGGILL